MIGCRKHNTIGLILLNLYCRCIQNSFDLLGLTVIAHAVAFYETKDAVFYVSLPNIRYM